MDTSMLSPLENVKQEIRQEETEHFIRSVLSQLSLEEKVSLLSGSNFFAATGIPRLKIPTIRTVDSVNGVKGHSHINGTSTLCFPSTTCLGATWNRSLLRSMGNELAIQAKYKSASVILGPTVNIHRSPLGGRNFECFSEDPLLTGTLAATLINGIQDNGVAACPKHFVANESEFKRRFYNVNDSIDGRTMREIYLAAFQHLLRDSKPWAMMTAYNKLDGTYCSENPAIKNILRGEWNYDGCVMSDWFGTRSGLPAVNAGLDLEMPGPSVFRGQRLVEDVKTGLISEHVIDERARNVLKLIHRTSASHTQEEERSVINEEANSLARQVASEGIVLLKNKRNILPLNLANKNSKLAVIGPFALNPPIGGGGSAQAPPQYVQTPFQCLQNAHLRPSNVKFSPGMKQYTTVPAIPLAQCTSSKTGRNEIDICYYQKGISEPMLVLEESIASVQTAMLGFIKQPLTQESFSHFTMSTLLTPTTTGIHTLAIQATSSFVLSVDNVPVLRDAMYPPPSVEDFLFVPTLLERKTSFFMEAGRQYHIQAVIQPYKPLHQTGEPLPHAAKLCFLEAYSPSSLLFSATTLARSSDISVIFAGRDATMESEGFDLSTLHLPAPQVSMIKEVAAASKKTVLVLYGGNPIDISEFEDDVDAILFAHFPGQEGSQAIIDILTGKTCPSGRLATSWPMQLADVSSFSQFPAAQNENEEWEISYTEGLRVGYRNKGVGPKPRYAFGYGLSYTTFSYSSLSIKTQLPTPSKPSHRKDGELVISVEVENTGDVVGYEVIQAFVSDLESSVWRPEEELKAFDKIWLEPGEKKIIEMRVNLGVAVGFWDDRVEGSECWRAEEGEFDVRVGECTERFVLSAVFSWTGL